MPIYSKDPNAPVAVLQQGVPVYLFGTHDDRTAQCKLFCSNVALTSNVATLTVSVAEGNAPAVGSKITVRGSQQAGGAFNVTDIALTAVSINATTGIGTVAYALTHGDVVSHADAAVCAVRTPEVSEALVNNSFSTPGVVLQRTDVIKVAVSCPTIPTTATVNLQEALVNLDSEYSSFSPPVLTVTGGTASGGQLTVSGTPGNFYRLSVTSLTGSGTIVGKVMS